MVQTKIIPMLCLAALLMSCANNGDFTYEWQKFAMDGHRTGVRAAENGNIDGTLGQIGEGKYLAPNGTEYEGCTMDVAQAVLAVQDSIAPLRTVIGHSANGMVLESSECALSDWIADSYIEIARKYAGEKVDASLTNYGGIRTDIPSGQIILDDITSMFPFKNYFCIVTLKGRDLWDLFDKMGKDRVQIFGGMRLEYAGGNLVKASVGGKKLNPSKEYKLVTIDFLLDGGDRIEASRNAVSVKNTGLLVKDGFISYIKELEAAGKTVDYTADGRLTLK